MARLIPAAERIARARKLIQQARDLPVPAEGGRGNFSYVAQVKDLLRQARELVKFIPLSPSATDQTKEDARQIAEDATRADREILHG